MINTILFKAGNDNLLKYTLLIVVLIGILLGMIPVAYAAGSSYKEYDIKAAFIYNFMKFVSWPGEDEEGGEKVDENTDEPIIIGLIGENPFGKSMDAILKKKILGREIVLYELTGYEEGYDGQSGKYSDVDRLEECRLLFVSSSEKKHVSEIIEMVKRKNVLTVSETNGFLDDGGIINFVTHKNKIRFEINVITAKEADLKIRSQLLRLAKKVIKD